MAYSPPGSSVHGILQLRILKWLPCSPPGELPFSGIRLISYISCLGNECDNAELTSFYEKGYIQLVSGRWNKLNLPAHMARAFYLHMWSKLLRSFIVLVFKITFFFFFTCFLLIRIALVSRDYQVERVDLKQIDCQIFLQSRWIEDQ